MVSAVEMGEVVMMMMVLHSFSWDMHRSVGVLHSFGTFRNGKRHGDPAVGQEVAVQFLFGGDCAFDISLCVFHVAIALGFAIDFVRVHLDLGDITKLFENMT